MNLIRYANGAVRRQSTITEIQSARSLQKLQRQRTNVKGMRGIVTYLSPLRGHKGEYFAYFFVPFISRHCETRIFYRKQRLRRNSPNFNEARAPVASFAYLVNYACILAMQ